MTDTDMTTDIAIIGAGAAGTYCAYRLARETGRKVTLFEASDRVGGRLWSYDWAEAGTMVELGGEAFSPAHPIVARLTAHLGLTVVPHDPFNAMNRYFLRDRLTRPEDIGLRSSYPGAGRTSDAVKLRFAVPPDYFVPPSSPVPPGPDDVAGPAEALSVHLLNRFSPEVGTAFGSLMQAFAERLGAVAGMTPEGRQQNPLRADQVADFVTDELYAAMGDVVRAIERSDFRSSLTLAGGHSDKPLPSHQYDLWSEVVNELGQEVYELFRATGYDNTAAFCFNLVEMAQELLLGALLGLAAPNFWTIKGGLDQLPRTLSARAGEAGAGLRTGHELRAVRRDAATGLTALEFATPDGTTVTCKANRVIMAAPISLFDEGIGVEGFDPDLTEAFRQRRKGVASVAAQKLYLVYPGAWWAGLTDLAPGAPPLTGYATTDLPNRAVYYKGLIGDGPRALITGALTDGFSSDFWTGFLSPDATLFPGTAEADRKVVGAPATMVGACHHLLFRMHQSALPTGSIPAPEMALYHEWRNNGGGWSAWRSGRDIHAEAALLRRPFVQGADDQGLYCCGDSVAERHGWVENVLESAEALLREGFGLPAAPWGPKGAPF